MPFSGVLSFSHLPYALCLEDNSTPFDIAILGLPFDTATSYRPGARFGPYAIRSGSRRQRSARQWTLSWGSSPDEQGSIVLDCGDVPITPVDNLKALDQVEVAYSTLLARHCPGGNSNVTERMAGLAKDKRAHPRIVSLGGDHTVTLPILRALSKVYGPISVIHFDAHLDTSQPRGSRPIDRISHGTYFTVAYEEGIIGNNNIHAGIRQKMVGVEAVSHDIDVGFALISTDDIDDYGVEAVIRQIRKRIGDSPVYLSLDIDVIDPGLAPATGTPEVGGWTTREMKRILRGLTGLNFVGADLVEVAPAYDHAEITGIAAADLVHDFLLMMQMDKPPRPHTRGPWKESDKKH